MEERERPDLDRVRETLKEEEKEIEEATEGEDDESDEEG
jgi:hypothetical protein